jgi:hypothetical protein
MHSTDYVQERSILIAAINDNNDRLMNVELANLGTLSGIRSGTTFPSSPAPKIGDLFFRTDSGKLYIYDETSTWDDDPSKTYSRALSWVQGYGLGTQAKDIGNTDLNTLSATGFYKGGNLTNAPDNDTWFVQHFDAGSAWKTQIIYRYGSNKGTYTRALNNGTWGTWTQVLSLSSNGIMTVANQPYAYAFRNASLSVASGVATRLAYDGVSVDRLGDFANNIFTARETGLYMVVAQSIWNAAPSGDTYHYIYKNGSNALSRVAGIGTKYPITTDMIQLNAGGQMEFYVLQRRRQIPGLTRTCEKQN